MNILDVRCTKISGLSRVYGLITCDYKSVSSICSSFLI
jgi:hypothetical protein